MISQVRESLATDPQLPQLLIRSDGQVFRPVLNGGPAPASWRHTSASENVKQIGGWLVGPKDNDHFVINRIGSDVCELLIHVSGRLYLSYPTVYRPPVPECSLWVECDGITKYRSSDTQCSNVRTCAAGQEQQTAPTATSDRTCQACDAGKFTAAAGTPTCTAWSTCSADQYEEIAGTDTSDRVCGSCRVCPATHHELAPCTATTDRECNACTDCVLGVTYTMTPCSDTKNTVCAPCTDCLALGKHTATPCTVENNAACVDATECGSSQYEAVPLTASTDRVCMTYTECAAGWIETTAATPTSDRSCAPCPAGSVQQTNSEGVAVCTPCPAGTDPEEASAGDCEAYVCPAGEVDHDADPKTACQACDGNTNYMNETGMAGQCKPVTVCPAGQERTTDPTTSSDAECSPCVFGNFSRGDVAQICSPWLSCNASTECEVLAPTHTSDRLCLPTVSVQCLALARASKSESTSSAVTIGAPVAGVVLLLVLIVVAVVLMRRRNRPTSSSAASQNRGTVAFENPMYESSEQVRAHDHMAAAEDGLYSEPSFQSNKLNPMYQEDDDAGTYDNAAADGAYLDVEPEDPDQ